MEQIRIAEAYKTLQIAPGASDEEVTKAFKKLALQYHPDRNRDNTEWANKVMATINTAYSEVMSYRFRNAQIRTSQDEQTQDTARPADAHRATAKNAQYQNKSSHEKNRQKQQREQRANSFAKEIIREQLVSAFVNIREETKDVLYRYFQFKLYSISRRENHVFGEIFKEVVDTIRDAYHKLQAFKTATKDTELIAHFTVFSAMIFDFYRASECLNILDSYSNYKEIEAYRLYREGDEFLLSAQREIFFDRHNRGRFLREQSDEAILNARLFFLQVVKKYPESSWAVETKIKLDAVESLNAYVDLFFDS